MDEVERWTIKVDRAACIGSGSCAGIAPAHFRLEDGKSRAIDETVAPEDSVLDAANLCPAEAISLHDSSGRQLTL